MAAVRALADRYIDDLCKLDPVFGSYLGAPGSDLELTDHSPDGAAARAGLAARTLAELEATEVEDDGDRTCRRLLLDRLQLIVDQHDAGEHLRALRVIGSPIGTLRSAFDQMPHESEADWEHIAVRLEAVPWAYWCVRRSLEEGLERDVLAAPRQALACADQLATWAGERGAGPWFETFVAAGPQSLRDRLDTAARAATEELALLSGWLRSHYAARVAEVPDGVGIDRYRLGIRQFLGAAIDPDEAYEWAWDELARIETEMRTVSDLILPGATIEEAMEHLDQHGDAVEGEGELRGWLQDLMDRTVDALQGSHFDLAPEVAHVEAMIAAPGTAAAQYYTAPSADFSRPGRTWYPTLGKTRFPLWSEVSTCYHEGVPGHHMQLAQWVYRAPQLSRFQTYTSVSGNVEGWALYAERLMDELGFLADPGQRLGYLAAQQLRATRVIIDIGMHLSLPLPSQQPFHPGERWTPELGREFLGEHALKDPAFLDSEWVRYLGWPAQAISYKLGERVWLAQRAVAQQRAAASGGQLDLKEWHMAALSMGSTGLDDLAAELGELGTR
jgi:uncharacterized protein (DUF885 family)